MVFSSLFFVYAFFPLCMLLYYANTSIKWRNGVLLVFSLVFYSWGEPTLVLLMLATVTVNYLLGLGIDKFRGSAVSTIFMALSVIVSLGSLGVFKYAGFFIDTINGIFGSQIPVPQISLPIGISFYTFQILTYVLDVYKGKVPVQKSFFKLMLYISCFHQLIAGPIVRYEHVAAEIEDRSVTPQDITDGIKRFIIGFAKKVMLANMCGQVATEILDGSLSSTTVIGAWYGIIMYTLQIYFDFSAYSDMAIGMGRMCGFHYRENFDYPYMSRSVTEFWRRWHMSLGSFFRDYVYIPMGGNRVPMWRYILNLFTVWFLTGMWHGASWNFIIWGLLYFVFLVIEKFFLKKYLDKIPFVPHIYTMLIIMIGWVFFYYTDLSKALEMLGIMFGFSGHSFSDIFIVTKINNSSVVLQAAILCCMPILKFLNEFKESSERRLGSGGKVVAGVGGAVTSVISFAVHAALFIVSSIMLVGESYNPFLYFRF